MINFPECVPCMLSQALFVIDESGVDEKQKEKIFKTVLNNIQSGYPEKSPMELATDMHRFLRETLKFDPYKKIKDQSNTLMKELEPDIEKYYIKYKDDLKSIIKLVITGNIIDIKSHDELDRLDLSYYVDEIMDRDFKIDHFDQFNEKLQKSNNILYLGDNVGETFFDKILLKYLSDKDKKIIYSVRGSEVLNDAVLEDASFAGIDKIKNVKVISNGYDAPGTLYSECSQEFKDCFDSADMIISKGQGNFESLNHVTDRSVFFLFLSKCRSIAKFAGTDTNDIILMYSKNNGEK